MKYTYIYGLKDPRDEQFYYIGKSNRPSERLYAHIKDKKSNRLKAAWIDDLQAHGMEPLVEILDKVPLSDWKDTERNWIAYGFESGWPLTNISEGGTGTTEYIQDDWRSVMDAYLTPENMDAFLSLKAVDRGDIARFTALEMIESERNARHNGQSDNSFMDGFKRANELVEAYKASGF